MYSIKCFRFVQKQMGIWKAGYRDEDSYAVQPIDPSVAKYVDLIKKKILDVENYRKKY